MKKIIITVMVLLLVSTPILAAQESLETESFFSRFFTSIKDAFTAKEAPVEAFTQEVDAIKTTIEEEPVSEDPQKEIPQILSLEKQYIQTNAKVDDYSLKMIKDPAANTEEVKLLEEDLQDLRHQLQLKQQALKTRLKARATGAMPLRHLENELTPLEEVYYLNRLVTTQRRLDLIQKETISKELNDAELDAAIRRVRRVLGQTIQLYDKQEFSLLSTLLDELDTQLNEISIGKVPNDQRIQLQLTLLTKRGEQASADVYAVLDTIKNLYETS